MQYNPSVIFPVAPLWCDLGFFPNSRGYKAATNLRPNSQLSESSKCSRYCVAGQRMSLRGNPCLPTQSGRALRVRARYPARPTAPNCGADMVRGSRRSPWPAPPRHMPSSVCCPTPSLPMPPPKRPVVAARRRDGTAAKSRPRAQPRRRVCGCHRSTVVAAARQRRRRRRRSPPLRSSAQRWPATAAAAAAAVVAARPR